MDQEPMPFTISLPAEVEDAVRQRAARTGKPADFYVAELVEQAVRRPTLRQILAPLHQEVAASGITSEELDQTLLSAIEAVRRLST